MPNVSSTSSLDTAPLLSTKRLSLPNLSSLVKDGQLLGFSYPTAPSSPTSTSYSSQVPSSSSSSSSTSSSSCSLSAPSSPPFFIPASHSTSFHSARNSFSSISSDFLDSSLFEESDEDEDEINFMKAEEIKDLGPAFHPVQHLHQQMQITRPLRQTNLGTLYSGAQFYGTQTSGKCKYNVLVTFHNVDLVHSKVEGFLRIENLTKEMPVITTLFDGDIIGKKHSFLTRKWHADSKVDEDHWSLFTPFAPYKSTFNKPDFDYDFIGKEHLFMRWKEHFLAFNHKCTTVEGASFSGFYYVCLSLYEGKVTGYYYHCDSERYQLLELSHLPQSSFSSYEFR